MPDPLLRPLTLRSRTARNRVFFGPHETNLGRGRSISERHVAYYRRRAAGGAGVVVTEEASVHPSDWPYERAPLAAECGGGWAQVAGACHAEGALALAAIGHAGGQGSSAYSQAPLWAPSRVPDVNSREVPKAMEKGDLAAAVDGFAGAAAAAVRAGMDGVEVNAGQHSLVRQFLSPLTNQRQDEWGADRGRFALEVLGAVRAAAGDAVVGLRLCADELAPWAGITPEAAAAVAAALAPLVDYVTVVRGSIFTVAATRPDGHTAPMFNRELAASLKASVAAGVAVVLQGSVVDAGEAAAAVGAGACDAVEMTRAQIADPDLVSTLAAGRRPRPCILCNQACQVRDVRNPIVSCVGEPSAGHETEDPPVPGRPVAEPLDVLVVGGGVAGLECARVAALAGHRVTVAERAERPGGMLAVAARGAGRGRLAALASWLEAECARLGVTVKTGWAVDAGDVAAAPGPVVLCTGSRPGWRPCPVEAGAAVVDAAGALSGARLPAGPVAVWDPLGGPVAVSVAETLRGQGRPVTLITPDLVVGTTLSRTGDLAPANARLLAAGVELRKRSDLLGVRAGAVTVVDRFSGVETELEAAALVDAGARLPDDRLWRATGGRLPRAGDAVAPRTVYEAVLEGRRAAHALGGGGR